MAAKKKRQYKRQLGAPAAAKQEVVLAPVRTVSIDSLLPRYASRAENPNKVDDEKYDLLKAAIAEEGFLQPILVSALPEAEATAEAEWRIEDGHHRWWAARENGLREITVVEKHTTDARARLLGIGMNRLRGEVDLTAAAGIIAEAQAELDLPQMELSMLTGFSTSELDLLLAKPEDVEDVLEDAAEIPEEETQAAEFVLEIKFADRDKYRMVRRKLRRMGKGDLAVGVLAALGESEEA